MSVRYLFESVCIACPCNACMCVDKAVMKTMLSNFHMFHTVHADVAMDWGKEQQIEIGVGAHESETRICRHVNFCWSKVHAISPMLHDNDLV